MYQLIIENERKEQYNITNDHEVVIASIDGLSAVNAVINTSKLVNLAGTIYNSATVNERQIIITGHIVFDAEKNRLKMYKFFPPQSKIRLYYSTGTRNVFIDGYVEMCHVDAFELNQPMQFSIKCPNPYFIDELTQHEQMQSIVEDFHFEFSNEINQVFTFGHYEEIIEKNIIYRGEVKSGMVIKLIAKGTVINPVIINKETRESLKIEITMQVGDIIIIDTSPGDEKYVHLIRDAMVINIFNYLVIPEIQDEWLLLHIGDNIFTYEADSGKDALMVSFSYNELYIGV